MIGFGLMTGCIGKSDCYNDHMICEMQTFNETVKTLIALVYCRKVLKMLDNIRYIIRGRNYVMCVINHGELFTGI